RLDVHTRRKPLHARRQPQTRFRRVPFLEDSSRLRSRVTAQHEPFAFQEKRGLLFNRICQHQPIALTEIVEPLTVNITFRTWRPKQQSLFRELCLRPE